MLTFVVGTRPNIIKLSPIYKTMLREFPLDFRVISTCQHTSPALHDDLLDSFGIVIDHQFKSQVAPSSRVSVSQWTETMAWLESTFRLVGSSVVVVFGDVDSSMLGALVANRLGIRVAHIEAGLRSYEHDLPEEVNRRIIDSCSQYYFTTDSYASRNIYAEFGAGAKIYEVGNLLAENLSRNSSTIVGEPQNRILITLHRKSLKNNLELLRKIAVALVDLHRTTGLSILHITHPNAPLVSEVFAEFFRNEAKSAYVCQSPLTHDMFVDALRSSSSVFTDSGGLQEECAVLRVPCVTLRSSTERPITVDSGWNALVDPNSSSLAQDLSRALIRIKNAEKSVIENWDGFVSQRIARELTKICTY
jgi:UDP-N-acetylglucosamine 2-epimerase (non-hydrolysing)